MNQELELEAKKLQESQYQKFTIAEIFQLLHVANKTGLDPFSRQIYATKRWDKNSGTDKVNIQASIDGFRVVAERSGKYVGQVGPFWHDGTQWVDYWLSNEPPVAAKVGVLRSDFKEVLWAFARFEAYVQKTKEGKPTMIWANMPELMIAKCAEALALRKAFPQDLSGIYSSDEIVSEESANEKIDNDKAKKEIKQPEEIKPPEEIKKPEFDKAKKEIKQAIVQPKQAPVAVPAPAVRLQEAAKINAWTGEQMRTVMIAKMQKMLIKDLSQAQVSELCEIMKTKTFAEIDAEMKGSVK